MNLTLIYIQINSIKNFFIINIYTQILNTKK